MVSFEQFESSCVNCFPIFTIFWKCHDGLSYVNVYFILFMSHFILILWLISILTFFCFIFKIEFLKLFKLKYLIIRHSINYKYLSNYELFGMFILVMR